MYDLIYRFLGYSWTQTNQYDYSSTIFACGCAILIISFIVLIDVLYSIFHNVFK